MNLERLVPEARLSRIAGNGATEVIATRSWCWDYAQPPQDLHDELVLDAWEPSNPVAARGVTGGLLEGILGNDVRRDGVQTTGSYWNA